MYVIHVIHETKYILHVAYATKCLSYDIILKDVYHIYHSL